MSDSDFVDLAIFQKITSKRILEFGYLLAKFQLIHLLFMGFIVVTNQDFYDDLD